MIRWASQRDWCSGKFSVQDYAAELQHDADDPDPWADTVVQLLQGWQLLTSDANRAIARMHRASFASMCPSGSPRPRCRDACP